MTRRLLIGVLIRYQGHAPRMRQPSRLSLRDRTVAMRCSQSRVVVVDVFVGSVALGGDEVADVGVLVDTWTCRVELDRERGGIVGSAETDASHCAIQSGAVAVRARSARVCSCFVVASPKVSV